MNTPAKRNNTITWVALEEVNNFMSSLNLPIELTGSYSIKVNMDVMGLDTSLTRNTEDLDYNIVTDNFEDKTRITDYIVQNMETYISPSGVRFINIVSKQVKTGTLRVYFDVKVTKRKKVRVNIDLVDKPEFLADLEQGTVSLIYLFVTKLQASLSTRGSKRTKDIYDMYLILSTVYSAGLNKGYVSMMHQKNLQMENFQYQMRLKYGLEPSIPEDNSSKWLDPEIINVYVRGLTRLRLEPEPDSEHMYYMVELVRNFILGYLDPEVPYSATFRNGEWKIE